MSLSYAAHINGDKVYDIATGYWIEAKQEAAASAGRMQWSVYLYDDTGTFVEKYAGGTFPENQADLWEFAGFDIVTSASTASWHVFTMYNHSSVTSGTGTSTTLKQYFSGEQGYAINADYAVIDVQPYSITENGTYTAPFSKAYSPITVDVQEQPWQPLEDGYSNFWFELTNDTLSPWLNFSAKNNAAVIDWGDGSGEVALDTLTPTHTYAKAGKYVVKVKGVTEIAQQRVSPDTASDTSFDTYLSVLKAVELNSDVTLVRANAFGYMVGLERIVLPSSVSDMGSGGVLYDCSMLKEIDLSATALTSISISFAQNDYSLKKLILNNSITSIGTNAFSMCISLRKVTLPPTLESMGTSAFYSCYSLSEVHVQATTPPTMNANCFTSLPSGWLCYVPVGTAETYKAAARWSAYADHILEEGQTPNRAMLSRLAKTVETDTDEDMR